jgi:hypothetical protein
LRARTVSMVIFSFEVLFMWELLIIEMKTRPNGAFLALAE